MAIKYVYKSRVLVDCWTRDQNLGLVPAEIHVLNTLKKIPHVNCSGMRKCKGFVCNIYIELF